MLRPGRRRGHPWPAAKAKQERHDRSRSLRPRLGYGRFDATDAGDVYGLSRPALASRARRSRSLSMLANGLF
jgi:hypothetical protein